MDPTSSTQTHREAGTHKPLVQTDSGESVSSLNNHPSAGNVDKYDLTPVPHIALETIKHDIPQVME